MLLNDYIICLRSTQGSTINRIVQSGGETLDGKMTLTLMTKGERFIRCRRQKHGSRGRNSHKDAEERGMFLGGA
jgi:hypothetical protein